MKLLKDTNKTKIIVLVISLIFVFLYAKLGATISQKFNLSKNMNILISIIFDISLIVLSYIMAKISKLSSKDLGLFVKFPIHIIIILGVGLILCIVNPLKYSFLAFIVYLLGAFSEELFFRGLIFGLMQNLITLKWLAVIIQGILFGIIHYFGYGSLLACLSPLFCGLIFCTLRVLFPEKIGISTLTLLHWINNFMLN